MGIQHIPNCSCKTCTSGEKYDMVHIHVHSDHSNLDGVNRIDRLVKKAAQLGQKALSLNDHGNPSGIFQFYKACKKENIKPILGLEFYITNDLEARVSNKEREFEDRDWHQSIFIKNAEGYKNYNYLTYISFNEGYYYKPRIDYDLLFSRAKGLIATSSCIASKINNYITAGNTFEAEKLFKRFRDVFGDDFYGEIQLNELNDMEKFGISQKMNNQFIIDMCRKYDVPVLIGGDIHYLDPEDNELQDAIINSKRMAKEGEEGFKIHARTLYLSGPEDIISFNSDYGFNYDIKFLEECFENSLKFAEKVDFDFEMGKYHMPKIKTQGMTSEEYLDKVTWEGLQKNIEIERKYYPEKFTNDEIDELEVRVNGELEVIKNMGVADYMLIVHDIIKWEKENNIYVGAGRGCFLPGSMVTLFNNLKVRIEDIKIGDEISNYFSVKGLVSNTFEYDIDEEIVELEFENGKKISCTKDHEFYTKNRGWIKADELTDEDEIEMLK